MNNLFAACVGCNCSKQDASNRVARAVYGKRCAPLTQERHSEKIAGNAILGGCAGALIGASILGPAGFLGGLIIGALAGSDVVVDK